MNTLEGLGGGWDFINNYFLFSGLMQTDFIILYEDYVLCSLVYKKKASNVVGLFCATETINRSKAST